MSVVEEAEMSVVDEAEKSVFEVGAFEGESFVQVAMAALAL